MIAVALLLGVGATYADEHGECDQGVGGEFVDVGDKAMLPARGNFGCRDIPVTLIKQSILSDAPTAVDQILGLAAQASTSDLTPLIQRVEPHHDAVRGAVGRLAVLFGQSDGNPDLASWCTATVVAPDLVLTNHHCITPGTPRVTAKAAQLRLGYFDEGLPTDVFRVTVAPIAQDAAMDYALLRIENHRMSERRIVDIRNAKDPVADDALFLLHHPFALPMFVTDRYCQLLQRNPIDVIGSGVRHICDALPGSSGSILFAKRSDGQSVPVALHHSGVPATPAWIARASKYNGNKATKLTAIAANLDEHLRASWGAGPATDQYFWELEVYKRVELFVPQDMLPRRFNVTVGPDVDRFESCKDAPQTGADQRLGRPRVKYSRCADSAECEIRPSTLGARLTAEGRVCVEGHASGQVHIEVDVPLLLRTTERALTTARDGSASVGDVVELTMPPDGGAISIHTTSDLGSRKRFALRPDLAPDDQRKMKAADWTLISSTADRETLTMRFVIGTEAVKSLRGTGAQELRKAVHIAFDAMAGGYGCEWLRFGSVLANNLCDDDVCDPFAVIPMYSRPIRELISDHGVRACAALGQSLVPGSALQNCFPQEPWIDMHGGRRLCESGSDMSKMLDHPFVRAVRQAWVDQADSRGQTCIDMLTAVGVVIAKHPDLHLFQGCDAGLNSGKPEDVAAQFGLIEEIHRRADRRQRRAMIGHWIGPEAVNAWSASWKRVTAHCRNAKRLCVVDLGSAKLDTSMDADTALDLLTGVFIRQIQDPKLLETHGYEPLCAGVQHFDCERLRWVFEAGDETAMQGSSAVFRFRKHPKPQAVSGVATALVKKLGL